jgi:hypothetical protein
LQEERAGGSGRMFRGSKPKIVCVDDSTKKSAIIKQEIIALGSI